MNDVDKPRPARVFLSYSKSDQPTARYIADGLKRSGVHAWLDDWELGPGDSLREHIGSAATSSDYILVLLSPASVESTWVRQEIDFALSRELADRAIRLIPILIADCDIPAILRSRHYLDLRENREAGMQRLISQIAAVSSIQLSNLTPRQFENLVGDLLVQLGFSVEAQMPDAKDAGFDFKAVYRSRDPFGVERTEIWLAEAKLYRDSRVSIATLRQALGLLSSWPDATTALIVTSGNITSEARSFLAESKLGLRIRVVEGPELTNLIAKYPVLVERHFSPGGDRG
jgi:hypothetical protein